MNKKSLFCSKHILCFDCPFKLQYNERFNNNKCQYGLYRGKIKPIKSRGFKNEKQKIKM